MSRHSSAPLGLGTGPHSNRLLLECQRESTHNMNKYLLVYIYYHVRSLFSLKQESIVILHNMTDRMTSNQYKTRSAFTTNFNS